MGEGAALSRTVPPSDGEDPRRIDCDQLRAFSWLGRPRPATRPSGQRARRTAGRRRRGRTVWPLGATTIFSTTSHTSRGVVRFGGGDAKRQKRPETPSKWQPGSRSGCWGIPSGWSTTWSVFTSCSPAGREEQGDNASMSSTSGQATLEDWLTRIDLIEIEVNESNTFRPHTAFLYRRSVGTHMAPDTDGSRRGDGARLRRARGPAGRSAPSATGHEPSAARPEAVHLSPPQARSTMTAPRPIVRKA